jgi:hypothetical protein
MENRGPGGASGYSEASGQKRDMADRTTRTLHCWHKTGGIPDGKSDYMNDN